MSDTQALSVDLGIPQVPDFVTNDPVMFAEFQRMYNAINNLAYTLDAYSGRAPLTEAIKRQYEVGTLTRSQYLDVIYAQATVNIPAGAAVYTRWNAGAERYDAYLAHASGPTTFCTGFCATDGGVIAGSLCAVQWSAGIVPYIGGLTEGQIYYLSDTPGTISNAPGTYTQPLGYAVAPTYFYFTPNPMWV